MEPDQQNGSSQVSGKRSASPNGHQDNKRLKTDQVNSEPKTLDDLLIDSDDDDDFASVEVNSGSETLDDLLIDSSDDEDDDDFDVEFDGLNTDMSPSSSALDLTKSISSITSSSTYDVLSMDEVTKQMDERIENACGVLQLPPTTTRALLNYCNWNKEKLLDAYFGGGDAKKLFKDAGIDSPSSQDKQSGGSSSSNGGKEECLICFSENESGDMFGMSCGHKFCKDCWRTALKTEIMEQDKGAKITCLAHNCSTVVDDDMLKQLITDETVLKKYKELVVSSFVQTNPSYKWCPGPGCTKAIKAQLINKINPQVRCECGCSFCFECSGDAHAPITCDQLRKWQIKYDLDAGNGNWLLSNTKPCPQCKANIQKNGGCNHMTCRKCNFYFCWNCLQPLMAHNGARCNQFTGQTNIAKIRNESTLDLERFIFYSNRFRSQEESLKMEKTQFPKIQKQVAEVAPDLTDISFIKDAIDVLCECRQTLQFTYVFAYLVEKNNQVDIFVENQNDLQTAVEKLSQFLEQERGDEQSWIAAKMAVKDLSNYCRARRQVLIDHVFEGYDKVDENDRWKFTNVISYGVHIN